MKRQNNQKVKPNRFSLEPSVFVFPNIIQDKLQNSFIIKTKQQKIQFNVHHPQKHITKQNIVFDAPKILNPQTPYRLLPTATNQKSKQTIILRQNEIVNKPKNHNETVDNHLFEQSISETSVCQFSEIDKYDIVMDNIQKVLSQRGSLLSIINEIQQADVLELKSIYPKLVEPLIKELQIPHHTTNWFKGLALYVSILEESLFRQELTVIHTFQSFVEGINNKLIIRIISDFLFRVGQQVQFIREEKLESTLHILKQMIDYLLPVIDIDEPEIEKIVRGCNQCFRVLYLRKGLTHINSKKDGLGRCGSVIVYTYCKFEKGIIPLFESFNFKQSYLQNVESQLKNIDK